MLLHLDRARHRYHALRRGLPHDSIGEVASRDWRFSSAIVRRFFLRFTGAPQIMGLFTPYDTHKTIKDTSTAALLAGNAAWDGIPARS